MQSIVVGYRYYRIRQVIDYRIGIDTFAITRKILSNNTTVVELGINTESNLKYNVLLSSFNHKKSIRTYYDNNKLKNLTASNVGSCVSQR